MGSSFSRGISSLVTKKKKRGTSSPAVLCDSLANSPITLDESNNFTIHDQVFLSDVPPNITPAASSSSASTGCFVGFHVEEPRSDHVVPIGKLKNIKFMSIFRFKVWWTSHKTGSNGADLKHETQILMLDKSDDGKRPYILLLPLLEGPFRASLQPGSNDDYVDICVESGSTRVKESLFRAVFYIHAGNDPFTLIKDAIKISKTHLGTFKLLEEKTPPGVVDKFGWCMRDAFCHAVHPHGVMEGVQTLVDGGCPPGMVLIDDGWQSIGRDDDQITSKEVYLTSAGEQMACRLTKFEENSKFAEYVSSSEIRPGKKTGMGAFVGDLKERFGAVEYVYVWHTSCGYWGGLRPKVPGLPEVEVVAPRLTPGLKRTMEDLVVEKIVLNGVGLVPREMAQELYEGLHSHLQKAGIDGVEVDGMQLLEMLSEDHGGRVELAKAYYKALTSSVNKHFKGNGVIASMEHCNDFMFLGTQAISLGHVGNDFWLTDPLADPNDMSRLQGWHMVQCAYNSLWMGNFIHPYWGMFQLTCPYPRFHAASRAISGGPICISGSIKKDDFMLLKSLVLPDGSILRCDNYALPTKDCLFEDPLDENKTALKIWNLNKFTGVLGVFNCQGNKCASKYSHVVGATTGPNDIEWKQGKNNTIRIEELSLFAMYLFREKKLRLYYASDKITISLEPFEFELITASPVKLMGKDFIQFAPIGLANMLNTGGAIQSVAFTRDIARIGVKGTGDMMVYASARPLAVKVNGVNVAFEYSYEDGKVISEVPWPNSTGLSEINYIF